MKNSLSLILIMFASLLFSQEITLSEAKSFSDNNDKRLYRIADTLSATYLGKVEMHGYLQNEVEAFSKFYKKAKTTGANAYFYVENKDLDGNNIPNQHKEILLYYVKNPNEGQNQVSVFNSTKEMKILFGGEKMDLPPRTYLTKKIESGEKTYIATRHFLGSRVNLYYKEGQPKQNYQVISGRISSDKSGVTGGLILKTGDIILLENSYADFLTVFYQKLN